MKIMRFSFFIWLFFILFFCDVLPVNSQEYTTYCNPRYGFCVDYPTSFKMEPSPDNGDGRNLSDGKGCIMTVSGINNVTADTIESEMLQQSGSLDEITCSKKGENWFVLSGFKGADILYLKTFVGTESINHLYIRYPVRSKTACDGIVDKISQSFRSGDINASH